MRKLFLSLLLLAIVATTSVAQTTRGNKPDPKWEPADAKLAEEAQQQYEQIKQLLLKSDYSAFIRAAADNKRPVLKPSEQSDAAVAKVVEDLTAKRDDLGRTRQLLMDAESLKPTYGPATTMQVTNRGMDLTLVKISLIGTKELATKSGVANNHSDTTDADGNLAVIMVKVGDKWYWNPFGW